MKKTKEMKDIKEIKVRKEMKNKTILIALGISVVINGFFIGCCIGRMVFRPIHNHQFENHGMFFNMDEERQAHYQTMIDSREKLMEVILKDPYDKEETLRGFAEFDAKMDDLRESLREKMADKLGDLPPEERMRFLPPQLPFENQHRGRRFE